MGCCIIIMQSQESESDETNMAINKYLRYTMKNRYDKKDAMTSVKKNMENKNSGSESSNYTDAFVKLNRQDHIKTISELIIILIAVFLLIAVNTFCKPCHGLMDMPCEHSKSIACIVLSVMTATSLISLIVGRKAVHFTVSVLNIICGIMLILIPLFGRCQISSMSCNMKTFPLLRVGGIFSIILTAMFTAISVIKNYSRSNRHVHTR